MSIQEVLSAPSSPWQNPYVERAIGSIRRECLNHVIVVNEVHLRRTLAAYLSYYPYSRIHLSLAKDAPTPRRVPAVTDGDVIAVREVGGLHHRYERRLTYPDRHRRSHSTRCRSVSHDGQ
jgi:putative transposase